MNHGTNRPAAIARALSIGGIAVYRDTPYTPGVFHWWSEAKP